MNRLQESLRRASQRSVMNLPLLLLKITSMALGRRRQPELLKLLKHLSLSSSRVVVPIPSLSAQLAAALELQAVLMLTSLSQMVFSSQVRLPPQHSRPLAVTNSPQMLPLVPKHQRAGPTPCASLLIVTTRAPPVTSKRSTLETVLMKNLSATHSSTSVTVLPLTNGDRRNRLQTLRKLMDRATWMTLMMASRTSTMMMTSSERTHLDIQN